MPKESESNRSFDPSDGLIGKVVQPLQPVTDASAVIFSRNYRRRKMPTLTGFARRDRH